MYDQFKELADVDITAGPMEVGPTTHYMMGGIRVDAETGATTRPGLFAAGEVAGGMHGANRLGGNSLSDLLVFGQRTGAGAADLRRERSTASRGSTRPRSRPRSPSCDAPLVATDDGESPYRLHEELQATMQSQVGIFRTAEDLDEAIAALDAICGPAGRSAAWPVAAPTTLPGTSCSRSATC